MQKEYIFGLNKRKPVQEYLVLLWLHMLTTRGPHPNSYSTRDANPSDAMLKILLKLINNSSRLNAVWISDLYRRIKVKS